MSTPSGERDISLLKPIAEFYNQTFLPAVRGFGLHKKNQKGSEASLESARDGYIQVREFISKSEENVRETFKLKLPNKLNGPEHSISAVTKSTIIMAIESLKSIHENINLAENQRVRDMGNNDKGASAGAMVDGEDVEMSGVVDFEISELEMLIKLCFMSVTDVMDIYEDLPNTLKSLKLLDIEIKNICGTG